MMAVRDIPLMYKYIKKLILHFRSMKRPKNWRDEVTPIYLEGGQAIGRIIMHDRTQEPYIWSLVGGTG